MTTITYRVEGGHFIFKKGKGYFNTRQLPAWRVVRSDGKASQLTSVEQEAWSWRNNLASGFRPTGIYL